MSEPEPLPQIPAVRRYVDGGAVLGHRPYTDARWAQVREGWWWHTAAMVMVPFVYPVVALTTWQAPSRQTLGRRVTWAVLATLGAFSIVGLPAAVVFSRRWYWMHRTGHTPESAGLGARRGGRSPEGYLGWAEAIGSRLVDLLSGAGRETSIPTVVPMLGEPWGSLRDEASVAARRLDQLDVATLGPGGQVVARARVEAASAYGSVARAAQRAAAAEEALAAMDRPAIEARLAEIEGRRGHEEDLGVARRALADQLIIADRMAAAVVQMEGQLHRMVAQLGEAAARAAELVVCAPGTPDDASPALLAVVDELHAVRSALEAVEAVDRSIPQLPSGDLPQVG